MGKMSPGHVRDLCSSPSHHNPRDLGQKIVLCAGPRAFCSVQPQDLVPCVPAAPAIAVAKRGQGTAQAVASDGVSPKPWQFLHDVRPSVCRRKELWFGNLCLNFRGCMEMPGYPDRSLLQGRNPHGEPVPEQCGREMWSWSPPIEFPLGHCLVEL